MDFAQISKLLAHPSWDLIIGFGFIAIGFFYGISAGRAKLIAVLFALYVSGFLFENFYYLGTLVKGRNPIEEFLFRAFIFFVLVIAMTVLFSKVLAREDYGDKTWWKALVLSFASTGLLFSFIFHLFPIKSLFTFSPLVQFLFVSNKAFFWWLVLPLVALFLERK